MRSDSVNYTRFVLSGALAGTFSAFIFTFVHDIFISDIWFSLLIMLVAGALCGASLAWSYTLLVDKSSLRSWLVYNLLYDAMFFLLALVSVLIFEPVTTMAALISLNGPPHDLIAQAMPITATFTFVMALVISIIYGFRWSSFGSALLTSVVLVLLLGLNVSVIGLVDIPRGSWYLVAEMLGLILMLNVAFVASFVVLERKALLRPSMNEQGAAA